MKRERSRIYKWKKKKKKNKEREKKELRKKQQLCVEDSRISAPSMSKRKQRKGKMNSGIISLLESQVERNILESVENKRNT